MNWSFSRRIGNWFLPQEQYGGRLFGGSGWELFAVKEMNNEQ
jgi:hypothetical protein